MADVTRRRMVRGARRPVQGAIYVEFLVAFPIMLMFFLCLTQLGLIYTADVAVEHAATRAARAAVVVLPDDPADYEGDPVNRINPEVYEASGFPGALGTILEVIEALTADSSDRMTTIRRAAWIPLIAISPGEVALTADFRVDRSIDSSMTAIGAGAVYASASTAVTFYDEPGSTDMIWEFDPRQDITTRVTHLYYCSVPLARSIICKSLGEAEDDESTRAELSQTSGRILSLWGGRFIALTAESTMPNQGADYEY